MSEISIQIIELPPFRVASLRVISKSPEEKAWKELYAWAEPKGFLNDLQKYPIFGFNNPSPSPNQTEYGYEFWIQIDQDTALDGVMEVKDFPGGLYAVTSCQLTGQPGIAEIWKQLWDWVESSPYRWRKTHELEKPQNPLASANEMILDLYLPIQWKIAQSNFD